MTIPLWLRRLVNPDKLLASSVESFTKPARLGPSREVHVSCHEDGLTLLDVATGRVFLCNQTATEIWSGIVGGVSVEDLSYQISQKYGLPKARVRVDADSCISELLRQGLLVRDMSR
jgi:hypothetical protein